MTLDNQRLSSGIRNLLEEYSRSVSIHTDWEGYNEAQCYEAVEDEFLEFRRAVITGQIAGPHGAEAEALHLACVALKAHLYFLQHPGDQMKTLRQTQSRFTLLVAGLINQAHVMGYDITLGEVFRSPEEAQRLAGAGKGIAKSLHCSRLAVDVNLFRGETYLSATADYQPLGEWWEAQGGSWGGRFHDGNHFSLAYEGRK